MQKSASSVQFVPGMWFLCRLTSHAATRLPPALAAAPSPAYAVPRVPSFRGTQLLYYLGCRSFVVPSFRID
eukprot:2666493-Rhodomonas_salina.1